MRNLKKILALALVFAMAFTFTASAASFTDAADIGINYVDDVNMLVELGVIAGYPDGSFGPEKNITRAEFAKMAYTLKYGSDADGELFAAQASKFVDVEGNSSVAWAKGYINYCANQNIVSGVGANKFNPQGNITVAEASKMILVILGCDPAKEGFTGANWMSNVVSKAIELGIYDGWAGDPSALATRQLVAKLMRNAIFSPVYTYSAITGTGSQLNALGTAYNQTLGEKTMGLKTVTGIVVANERYFLQRYDVETDISSLVLDATGEDSGESVIAYEYKNSVTNETEITTMVIDRAVADELLGNKVNVFFTADKLENNGRIDYRNIEVIGDVLVNSDTVVYTTSSIAADIYPDGDSTSTATIRPYIGIKAADGTENKIVLDVAKVAKNVDATSAVTSYINDFAYVLDWAAQNGGADIDTDGDFIEATSDAFVGDLGLPTLSQYRFVSVDGGKTFPYMFKFAEDTETIFGAITNKNASTIRVYGTSAKTFDLDDVVLNGDIAVDDYVVGYRANGKVVLDKVDVFNAAVESFTDDGVVLNDNEFFAWVNNQADDFTFGVTTIFDWLRTNNAMGDSTAYYAYGNIILDMTTDEEVAATGNYAVIISNSYDSNMEVAYVKLGFADGSIATYPVGKFYSFGSGSNYNDVAADFALADLSNTVVSYKILDNGTVDLSAHDLIPQDDSSGAYDAVNGVYATDIRGTGTVAIDEGKLGTYYGLNDSTILFVVYEDGRDMKVKAYKLSDIASTDTDIDVSYLLNTASDSVRSKYVVAAATRCDDLTNFNYDADDNIAYVVAARQLYNNTTDEYYAQLSLIDENGLVTAYTVDAVTDDAAEEQLDSTDGIGKLPALVGTFVRYEKDAEGVITMLDLDITDDADFDYVNISGERSDLVFFYEGWNDFTGEPSSAKYAEDGCVIVAIDDDDYDGDSLNKISKNDAGYSEEGYNAVIFYDEDDAVEKIFSFAQPIA